MAFFPQFYTSERSFTPLFRLLDDFDNYSREAQGSQDGGRQRRHHVRSFNPKFDVRETEVAYELHGELAGIDRDNVNIEFTEPQTLVVSGRVQRSYAGSPPGGLIEGGDAQVGGAITEAGEDSTAPAASNNHNATVEDEAEEGLKEQATPATTPGTEVAKPVKDAEKLEKPTAKYWVSERSIGEFSRTFHFPGRVDQDAVSANLNNGVLSILVPKAKKHESRRIAIN